MEHCFRIAFMVFLLIGYLQAIPLFNSNDLRLDMLDCEVKCGQVVNFTSPTYVAKPCYAEALKCFKQGLEQIEQCCDDEDMRADQTLEALEKYSSELESSLSANSSECKWGEKQFTDFVKDLKTFAQQLTSESA